MTQKVWEKIILEWAAYVVKTKSMSDIFGIAMKWYGFQLGKSKSIGSCTLRSKAYKEDLLESQDKIRIYMFVSTDGNDSSGWFFDSSTAVPTSRNPALGLPMFWILFFSSVWSAPNLFSLFVHHAWDGIATITIDATTNPRPEWHPWLTSNTNDVRDFSADVIYQRSL